MTTAQRKAIFGMCGKLGMNEDDRHALVLSRSEERRVGKECG